MKNFYISTSIAYVNGTPHLGYALETIMADSIARYKRMMGHATFFLTGTDEHGIKIYKTAEEQGITAQELCDKNAARFKDLTETLNISNDDFIRTSDKQKHWPSVQALWEKLEAKGDIYKKSYDGLYCEGCEVFLPEKDLIEIEGKKCCAIHKKEPTQVAEENYFFRLSNYSDAILKKIQTKELQIVPEFREGEILALLHEGLKDVSFSRPSDSLPWGIPVPTDASQNMYVWCDALTNYISALGYETKNSDKFEKFWNQAERVHVIGKDITRFHAGIWIGMLMSAEVELPNKILIHGFLTSEGEKMSKSTGNVVDPFIEVEEYGLDALRYFLLSQVPVGQDYDFQKEKFEAIYNAHLANNMGNFVNRVFVLSEKNGITPDLRMQETELQKKFATELTNIWAAIELHMKDFQLSFAMEDIIRLLDFANKQMDELKPWIVAKENPEALQEMMPPFLELSRQLSYMLDSFLPDAAVRLRLVLGLHPTNSLEEKMTWGAESTWKELGEKTVLFPRIEKK